MRNIKYILFILMIVFICISLYINKNCSIREKVKIIDTIYFEKQIDTIKYNIKEQDSIIINIKKQCENEIQIYIDADDAVVVEQFKVLVSE